MTIEQLRNYANQLGMLSILHESHNIDHRLPTIIPFLHKCVYDNNHEMLKSALETSTSDLEVKDRCGRTPFEFAVDLKDVEAAKMLFKAGSKVEKYNGFPLPFINFFTSAYVFCLQKHKDMIEYLMFDPDGPKIKITFEELSAHYSHYNKGHLIAFYLYMFGMVARQNGCDQDLLKYLEFASIQHLLEIDPFDEDYGPVGKFNLDLNSPEKVQLFTKIWNNFIDKFSENKKFANKGRLLEDFFFPENVYEEFCDLVIGDNKDGGGAQE